MKKTFLTQDGLVILPIIVILPFLILIATYFMNLSVASFRVAVKDQFHTHAQFSADAAIDFAMQEINENTTWTGTGTEVTLLNDGKIRTTYQVTVTDNSAESKTLTAVGRTYRPVGATTPESSVTIKVDLRAVTSGGTLSLVTGVGGLYMENSAKIVGGDVQVNGEISLKNTAQIGLSTSPLAKVEVAHQNCPLGGGPTYPQLCGPGNGEPITIENQARIYGAVKANNQTNGAGMSDPGLQPGSVTPGALPPHDRAAQIGAITTNITGAAASCSGSQTRTWAANTKITGDVTISNNCQVTVGGDVWITGTLTAQNSARIIASNSLASVVNPGGSPTIMIDGVKAEFKNSSVLQSNASNIGFQIITYWSTASCSPDCADVTGTDLYNSRDDTTIELQNSASGPETIFYARWTRVTIQNSGNIGALVGQTVELKNSGTITFGTSTTGAPTTTWIIDGYRRSFN